LAFKAIEDSKQVALLVPTTVLALQHYNSSVSGYDAVLLFFINHCETSKSQAYLRAGFIGHTFDDGTNDHRIDGYHN